MKTTGKVGVDLFLPEEDDLDAVLNPMLSALTELMARPPEGASLGAILGAYQLKDKLEERGFTIVPTRPTLRMQTAWGCGWFRSFQDRYTALLNAAWNE
jgi:hypothetical protein